MLVLEEGGKGAALAACSGIELSPRSCQDPSDVVSVPCCFSSSFVRSFIRPSTPPFVGLFRCSIVHSRAGSRLGLLADMSPWPAAEPHHTSNAPRGTSPTTFMRLPPATQERMAAYAFDALARPQRCPRRFFAPLLAASCDPLTFRRSLSFGVESFVQLFVSPFFFFQGLKMLILFEGSD